MKLDASDIRDLEPIIRAAVVAVLDEIRGDEAKANGQLSYREPKAAALLDVAPHVLRNARLRGELKASKVGRYVVYAHDELIRFLARRRTG